MRQRLWRPYLAVGVLATLVLTGCTSIVSGQNVAPPVAPNSNLTVVGDSGNAFDQIVKNSLDDVLAFWRKVYPSVSGGKQLPELKGKLYSVDGAHPGAEAKQNGCINKAGADAVVDNAFYCELDDSIAWDRNAKHLVPALGAKYGPLLVAMVFAHEFGHAVQQRLGLFDQRAAEFRTALGKPLPEAVGETAEYGNVEDRPPVGIILAAPDGCADVRCQRGCRVADPEDDGIEVDGKSLGEGLPDIASADPKHRIAAALIGNRCKGRSDLPQ